MDELTKREQLSTEPPSTSGSRQRIVYNLAQIDRVGQLIYETWLLRSVYPESEYDITIVTYPPSYKPKTNMAVYEIVTNGLQIAHTMDEEFLWHTHKNRNVEPVIVDGCLCSLESTQVLNQFVEEYSKNAQTPFHFQLTKAQIEKGKELRRKFGIPQDAPIITLHVREGGYLPDLPYHWYRDANIENYFSAIEYLIDQGYYIVRLGDKTMVNFIDPPKELIDAPFREDYDHLVDPYFIAESDFYLGMGSGPSGLAHGFGVPILYTNASVQAGFLTLAEDVLLPKEYYSKQLRRALSLEEILLSPAQEFFRGEEFESAGIELKENTPEQILGAVKEMLCRVRKEPGVNNTQFESRIRQIYDKALRANYGGKPITLALLNARFSTHYLSMCPEFLGHQF